jgi:hypothetical protein
LTLCIVLAFSKVSAIMESEAETETENETPVLSVEEATEEYAFGQHREWLRDRVRGESKYGDSRPPCPICYVPPPVLW